MVTKNILIQEVNVVTVDMLMSVNKLKQEIAKTININRK